MIILRFQPMFVSHSVLKQTHCSPCSKLVAAIVCQLLGSKSVTTKSMSESSRETFLKIKKEYEKLKLRILRVLHDKFLGKDHSISRTDDSRTSKQPNQCPTRPMASWIDQSNLPNGDLDRPIQLTIRQVGRTTSNSPDGELDRPIQLTHWRFGSTNPTHN